MLRALAAIACVPLAIIISSALLSVTGISYDSIRERAQLIRIEGSKTQRFNLADGTEVTVTCRHPRQVGVDLRCSVFHGSVYLVRLQFFESENERRSGWELLAHLQLLPAQADALRDQLDSVPGVLSGVELSGEEISIADVSRAPLGPFVWGNYNIDQEALKALVASYLGKSVSIGQIEVSDADVERVAEVFAGVAATYVGVFELRTDAYVMVFEGHIEFLIIVCFFVSLLLLLLSVLYEKSPGRDVERGPFWRASDSIAGTLTYLGLLGTLLGMFGTVTALSRIDYVDPMMKVFDQTNSFGSMALAIGTSVVGLAGSIVIWFAQTAVDLARK